MPPLSNRLWLFRSARVFLRPRAGSKARWLLSLSLLLLGFSIAANVVNSYSTGFFMSAIEHRDRTGFVRYAWISVASIAALSSAGVLSRYLQDELATNWREWQTHVACRRYERRWLYYHLKRSAGIDNIDQRISEDLRTVTEGVVSALFNSLRNGITIFSFSGVVWLISPTLLGVGLMYAVTGSILTIFLGGSLARLNYSQAEHEANLRAELIAVQRNAMAIALVRDERRIGEKLGNRIDHVILTCRKIIIANRNLNFFTNGYNYMLAALPALFFGPHVIAGEADMGTLTQVGLAFAALMKSSSFFVTNYGELSKITAATSRLVEISEVSAALLESHLALGIEHNASSNEISYVGVSLADDVSQDQMLLREFSATILPGSALAIVGSSGKAREAMLALFQATAGLRPFKEGWIRCPLYNCIAFLPAQPYVPSLDLYEVLIGKPELTVERAWLLLKHLGITITRSDGPEMGRGACMVLDSRRDRYLLAIFRILLEAPKFVLIDHLKPILGSDEMERVFKLFEERQITPVIFGEAPAFHGGNTVEIFSDGSWKRAATCS